jgi:hypothetical protein
VLRGVNFPEDKETEPRYYVTIGFHMRVEEWRGEICYQKNKLKSKTIRASQPEWNKDFTIKTQNAESCLMTLKVKESSELGLKTI